MDFSPGTVPILIDGDAYAMVLPRVYGMVHLYAIRSHTEPASDPL